MDRIKYVTWIRPKKIILFSLITIALLISGVILIVIPYAVDIDQLAFIICGSLLMVMSLPF